MITETQHPMQFKGKRQDESTAAKIAKRQEARRRIENHQIARSLGLSLSEYLELTQ